MQSVKSLRNRFALIASAIVLLYVENEACFCTQGFFPLQLNLLFMSVVLTMRGALCNGPLIGENVARTLGSRRKGKKSVWTISPMSVLYDSLTSAFLYMLEVCTILAFFLVFATLAGGGSKEGGRGNSASWSWLCHYRICHRNLEPQGATTDES